MKTFGTLATAVIFTCAFSTGCDKVMAQASFPINEDPSSRQALSAMGGHASIGPTTAGVNAGSPTRCASSSTQFAEARIGTVTDEDGGRWSAPAATHQGDTGVDLFNDCTGKGINPDYVAQLETVVVNPDGVEVTALIHADNYFELYVNGAFVCRDPIAFTPFNSTACRFKATYPMTIGLRAVDWEEHLGVGMEYARYNVGDGGVVASFSDGTRTDESWKAEAFYLAPLDSTACLKFGPAGERDSSACPIKPACANSRNVNACKAVHFAEPEDWATPGFNDRNWPSATVYTRKQFGPKAAYTELEDEFGAAKFLWSRNIKIDNVVLLRKTVAAP
ncbi:MAG: hypothetical protein KGS00_11575 [Alphaproteobacteria bacterium]|nr:hypothetical protein [Alphaproteobacteria bacterium]